MLYWRSATRLRWLIYHPARLFLAWLTKVFIWLLRPLFTVSLKNITKLAKGEEPVLVAKKVAYELHRYSAQSSMVLGYKLSSHSN